MTPQQIAAYKQQWMKDGGYAVRIHSDLRDRAKIWCKQQLSKEEWVFRKHTDVYEDTFFFESLNISQQFEEEFIRWVVRKHKSSDFSNNK